MEQLQVKKTNTVVLSSEDEQIAIQLYHCNQLTAFPISDIALIDWVKSIKELAPELDAIAIKKIIDSMKRGEIEFNPRLGVQNILGAYFKRKNMVY